MGSFVGQFYIPGLGEQEGFVRTYYGVGNPNLQDDGFFDPAPKPGDRYFQTDVDPFLEWIFSIQGVWVVTSQIFDDLAPDNTLIYDII